MDKEIVFKNAKKQAMVWLQDRNKDEENVRKSVKKAIFMVSDDLEEGEKINSERLYHEILKSVTTYMESATCLENNINHTPWLEKKKDNIEWVFWERYKNYLITHEDRPIRVVDKLDELTDDILAKIEDPNKKGVWSRRGMVVGQVQSGKTSNYIGLICKAIDAGYKLIIILAGLHNNLRSQTQDRIDEGVLGFDTSKNLTYDESNKFFGVGDRSFGKRLIVNSLTNSNDDGDFTKRTAEISKIRIGGDPLILVMKKNTTVLESFYNWILSQEGVEDRRDSSNIFIPHIPIMIIDDEADNASINYQVKEGEDPTKTNGIIRLILKKIKQHAYIGYTATPFANIFIHPKGKHEDFGQDLFPRDFIFNLKPPTDYIGPSKVFGLRKDDFFYTEEQIPFPIFREITYHQDFLPRYHKKDFVPKEFPLSLRESIRSFILSCAIRYARGQESNHNSMLIHGTRYTNVQGIVKKLVEAEITDIKNRISKLNINIFDPISNELKNLWIKDFNPTSESIRKIMINDPFMKEDELMTKVEWEKIEKNLENVCNNIQIKVINGTSEDILEYKKHKKDNSNGLNIIVIGGDKLSRGLTLEGLTVSYFLRASKMYDTLMQMGRWFGYRPGYADLMRIYTTKGLNKWFKLITAASEELRKEFDIMAQLNKSPADFGLRVRTHPECLNITAVNKMKSGVKLDLSYKNTLMQTGIFKRDDQISQANLKILEDFLKKLGEPTDSKKHIKWNNISATIILNFLSRFETHPEVRKAHPKYLSEYIQTQNKRNELINWTVILISTERRGGRNHHINGYQIGLSAPSPIKDGDPKSYELLRKRIRDKSHECLDLTEDQKKIALDMMIEDWANDEKKKERLKKNMPTIPIDSYVRRVRNKEKCLLLIYLLESKVEDMKSPIPGWAISFPDSDSAQSIQYKVNNKYWEEEFSEISED